MGVRRWTDVEVSRRDGTNVLDRAGMLMTGSPHRNACRDGLFVAFLDAYSVKLLDEAVPPGGGVICFVKLLVEAVPAGSL
jgi:hypothetical protein